jgi:hypothetical protein
MRESNPELPDNPAAIAEAAVLRWLTAQMNQTGQAVTRIRRQDLVPEGQEKAVSEEDWNAAVERMLDSGQILPFKINDLPDTLPLVSYSQTGYVTPERLLELLKNATPDQSADIRDYLEFHGVPLPVTRIRSAVTAAQKKRIDTAVRKLNEIRAEIAAGNPEKRVTWYLDGSGSFCLMVEDAGQMDMNQDDIAHSVRLKASGGGDW